MAVSKKKSALPKHHDAELLWRVAWTYIRTVIDTAHEPFLILDEKQRVLSANRTFYRFFRVKKKETEGRLVYQLGDGQWDMPALRKLLERIVPKNSFFVDYQVDHLFPAIGRKILLLNARRIFSREGRPPIVLLAMEDITKQKELEEKLRDYASRLNSAVSARTKELERRVAELERLNS